MLLRAQQSRAKSELMARLKAERVPYEERIEKLDTVTWPRPEAEFIEESFRIFREAHPWVGEALVRPKGIAREMVEGYRDFVRLREGVRRGAQRGAAAPLPLPGAQHPGPERAGGCQDRGGLRRHRLPAHDTSARRFEPGRRLGDAGRSRRRGQLLATPRAPQPPRFDLASRPKALAARVRAELHALVHDLAAGAFDASRRAPPCPDADDAVDRRAAGGGARALPRGVRTHRLHAPGPPVPPVASGSDGPATLELLPGSLRSAARRPLGADRRGGPHPRSRSRRPLISLSRIGS